MNTIINVSNILFQKKKSNQELDKDTIITPDINNNNSNNDDTHIEVDSSDIYNKINIDTFNQQTNREQEKDYILHNEIKDDKTDKKVIQHENNKKPFSITLLCYKIVYEVIIFFFYVILSPVYFFDTYTINISNNNGNSNNNIQNTDLNMMLDTVGESDSSNERLFFPKKLIPQSVLAKRKLLILDLDETLIHSTNVSEEPLPSSPTSSSSSLSSSDKSKKGSKTSQKIDSFQIEVSFKLPKNAQIPSIFANSKQSTTTTSSSSKQTDITTIYMIKQRPHLIQFLKTCNLWYDMIIYTASLREYSEPIINNLEYLSGISFKGRLYRHDCKVAASGYVKPLDHILEFETRGSNNTNTSSSNGNRGLVGKEGMIILDNMAVSFQEDVSNGIEIESWYGNGDDIELLRLLPLLEGLRNVADVRRVLSLSQGVVL